MVFRGPRWLSVVVLMLLAGTGRVDAQSELIVRLRDGADPELVQALRSGQRIQADARFATVESVRPLVTTSASDWAQRVFVLRYDSETARQAGEGLWQRDPDVLYVQPNGTYRIDLMDLEDETYADSLGHLQVIRAEEGWVRTQGNASVKLAILDTGLYFDHPDFQGQVWTNPGEIPGNGVDDDGNGYVDDIHGYDFVDRAVSVEEGDFFIRDNDPSEDGNQDHGTLTAGVMSAALNGVGVAGVAPDVSLVVIRAFGRDGVAEDDDLAAALVYAADLGVDVINLSFGRDQDSPLLHEAIQYAYARGSVIVGSGGNGGGDDPHYPSDYDEVIGVAWFTSDGQDIEGVGGQHGPGIDLGAPGTRIFTTLKPRDGDTRPLEEKLYGYRSGSSLSAPQVSGAAALLRSLDPTLTPAAVRGILTSTARDVNDPGWDHETAAGLLDVANALGLPYPTNVTITTPTQDGGTAADALSIRGSAIAPLFESWRVEYAEYDEDDSDPIGAWQPIAGPFAVQVRDTELGVWETASLEDGAYLIRLVVELASGQTVESRRRTTLDRTAPSLAVQYAGPAYFDGRQGILVEVETDDLTLGTLTVEGQGAIDGTNWDRRYGLFWPNDTAEFGSLSATVRVENRAGLTATATVAVGLDVLPLNSSLFTETVLDVPSGYLLETAPDFDGDGLLEIVFNAFVGGEPSDSVVVYEWSAELGFLRQAALPSQFIPRDVGDTDDDDHRELLFQFGTATVLAEAEVTPDTCPEDGEPEDCYPTEVLFSDITGPSSTLRPFWGARLGDLDGDLRGEIWGHDLRLRTPSGAIPETQWRVFEWSPAGYTQVAELENPTSNSDPDEPVNTFNEPRGLIGDFDGDGKLEWVAGDNDGDFIVYENQSDNTYAPIWSFETDRFNAGSRFAQGDFDGDGKDEFWGFTTPKTGGGTDDALFGTALLFDSPSNNQFAHAETLAFQGISTRIGAMAAADFDSDGVDELIVVHPPDLWVFSAANDWKPVYHTGAVAGADAATGLRSYRVTVADFDSDGVDELVIAGADGQMHFFDATLGQAGKPPPVWAQAYALDASTVRLAWTTPGADSVRVFAGLPGQSLRLIGTTTGTSFEHTAQVPTHYALRAYYGSTPSDLGPVRLVRPHAPATVLAVEYPEVGYIALTFSEPLLPSVQARQFVLDGDRPATRALLGEGDRRIVLHVPGLQAGEAVLTWEGVLDAERTPVGQQSVVLEVPTDAGVGTLLLESWDVVGVDQAVLRFSEPLDDSEARALSNYRVDPLGSISAIAFDPNVPEEVRLTLSGQALGATGLTTTIVVESMTARSGATLAPEGNVASLRGFADDLSDVYVFPNPYRQAEHGSRVVIAGLPREATITILSLAGEVVRVLDEFDGDGGAPWDLTDRMGQPVPSGVYLVRVESGDLDPVFEKIAVVR